MSLKFEVQGTRQLLKSSLGIVHGRVQTGVVLVGQRLSLSRLPDLPPLEVAGVLSEAGPGLSVTVRLPSPAFELLQPGDELVDAQKSI